MEDFEGADQVFFYDSHIPIKPLVERLNRIESHLVTRDLEALAEKNLTLPDVPADVGALASEAAVEPAAMKQHLTETYPEIVSDNTYLPESVTEALRVEIDLLEVRRLSDVNPLLGDDGVGQDALKKIGYTVQYFESG